MQRKVVKKRSLSVQLTNRLIFVSGLAFLAIAILGFTKTFRDRIEGYDWIGYLGIILFIVVLWRLFKTKKTYAYILLLAMLVGTPAWWIGWKQPVSLNEDKLIVLVAKFDGPEDVYGVRNQILEQLFEVTKNSSDTKIIVSDVMITAAQGSEYALKLGRNENADIVIWGWYRPTENPNLTLHIENLSPEKITSLKLNQIYQPASELADLESFSLQQKLGTETSLLIQFLSGTILYKHGDYQSALERFTSVLSATEQPIFVEKSTLLLYLGLCSNKQGQYDRAINYFNEVLEINPNEADAYLGRGDTLINLAQYDRAIQDYDQAIELTPNSADVYLSRGNAYSYLRQYDFAINDFSKSIALNPKSAEAYNSRGVTYSNLKQYERALQDFSQSIRLDPSFAVAYYNRGLVYQVLGKTADSEEDFKKYEELTGQKP